MSTGLTVLVQDQRRGHLHIEVGRTDDSARLAVSLGHDVRRLDGVLPESFQASWAPLLEFLIHENTNTIIIKPREGKRACNATCF